MGPNLRFYSPQDGGGGSASTGQDQKTSGQRSPERTLSPREQFQQGLTRTIEDFNRDYFKKNSWLDPAKCWPLETKPGSDGVNRIQQLADMLLDGGRQKQSKYLNQIGGIGTVAYPMGSTDTETIQYYTLLFERVGAWLDTWGITTDRSGGQSAKTTRSTDGQIMYVWLKLNQSPAQIDAAIRANASESHSTSPKTQSKTGEETLALTPKQRVDIVSQFKTRLTYELAVIVNRANGTSKISTDYEIHESNSGLDLIPFLRTSFVDHVLQTDFRADPTVLSVSIPLDPGTPDMTVANYLLAPDQQRGVLVDLCNHYARFLGCAREEMFTFTRTSNAFGRVTISVSLNVSKEEMEDLIVKAMSRKPESPLADDAKASQRERRRNRENPPSSIASEDETLKSTPKKSEGLPSESKETDLSSGAPAQTQQNLRIQQENQKKKAAENANQSAPVPRFGDVSWASNAIRFAEFSLTDQNGVPLKTEVENLAYLLNDPACHWDENAKARFMNYLVSMAYFVPEQYRWALFTPNLDGGQHTLLSNLRTWNAAEANDYMKSLYLVLSGDPVAEDQIPNNLLNTSVLDRLRTTLDNTPLSVQSSPDASGFQQIPPLRSHTIDRNGALEFLLYTAPAIIYNNQNLQAAKQVVILLAEMDDQIVARTGEYGDAAQRSAAGTLSVKNFYGMVVPAFAYAPAYRGILANRMQDILSFASDYGQSMDKLKFDTLRSYLRQNGIFTPVGREEIQDTPDGYLKLDLMRAVNITYVLQLRPLIPAFPVIPAVNVESEGRRVVPIPVYDSDSASRTTMPDPSKLYKFQGISVQVSDVLGPDGKPTGQQQVQLVDQDGNPVQVGVSRSPVPNARFDGAMPADMLAIKGTDENGQEFTSTVDPRTGLEVGSQANLSAPSGAGSQSAQLQSWGMFPLFLAASAFGSGQSLETPASITSSYGLSGAGQIYEVERKKDPATGQFAPIGYGDERLSVQGTAQGSGNSAYDKATGKTTGQGNLDIFTMETSNNILDQIYSRWWQLYNSNFVDSTSSSSAQTGLDTLASSNRRYGAFWGGIWTPDGAYRRDDLLLNPFSYLQMRRPLIGSQDDDFTLFQAGAGDKSLNTSEERKWKGLVNSDIDFGTPNARFTAGSYHSDSYLGGFLSPQRQGLNSLQSPLQTSENHFFLGTWRMWDQVNAIASLSNVLEPGARNQLQARLGFTDVGIWRAELAGLRNNRNDAWGGLLRGDTILAQNNGKVSRLTGDVLYDPSYGSGARTTFSSPSTDLQAAAYQRAVEYSSTDIRSMGSGPVYVQTGQKNNPWDVYKFYLSTRWGAASQLQMSGAIHPDYRNGAIRFLFGGRHYMGAYVEEIRTGSTASSPTPWGNTRYGVGLGGGYNLGNGLSWGGFGLSYDPWLSSNLSSASSYLSIYSPPGTSLSIPSAFGSAGASTEFVLNNRWMFRGAVNMFSSNNPASGHLQNNLLADIGFYGQLTPYTQLQATFNQTPFVQQAGASLVSTGYGFENLSGLSASVTYAYSTKQDPTSFEVGKYEMNYNLGPYTSLGYLHWRYNFPDTGDSAYRNRIRFTQFFPLLDDSGFGYINAQAEKWDVYSNNILHRWDGRVSIGIQWKL